MQEYLVYIKCQKYVNANSSEEAYEKACEQIEDDVDEIEIEEIVEVWKN